MGTSYEPTLLALSQQHLCLKALDLMYANGEVLPFKLTVCHELNFEKARDYKEKRYRDLRKDLKINCTKFEISFIEISALTFVPTSIKEFKKTCKSFGIDFDQLLAKCSKVAIRTTYYIYLIGEIRIGQTLS